MQPITICGAGANKTERRGANLRDKAGDAGTELARPRVALEYPPGRVFYFEMKPSAMLPMRGSLNICP